jgi:hypothetical protein
MRAGAVTGIARERDRVLQRLQALAILREGRGSNQMGRKPWA